eukprot:756781-Hanusia_phi.AAC.2
MEDRVEEICLPLSRCRSQREASRRCLFLDKGLELGEASWEGEAEGAGERQLQPRLVEKAKGNIRTISAPAPAPAPAATPARGLAPAPACSCSLISLRSSSKSSHSSVSCSTVQDFESGEGGGKSEGEAEGRFAKKHTEERDGRNERENVIEERGNRRRPCTDVTIPLVFA